jgi:hypothetical protein
MKGKYRKKPTVFFQSPHFGSPSLSLFLLAETGKLYPATQREESVRESKG